MEIDEKTLLPVKFDYMLIDRYLRKKGIPRNVFADYIGKSESAVSRLLGGTMQPNVETSVRIARFTGISLDLMYGIKNNNDIDTMFLPTEITDTIKEYLSKETQNYIVKTLKENKENKYKRILNVLFETKVNGEYGKETFMQMFTENILNMLVYAKLNDATFMELFAESANKLSVEINKYKTQGAGKGNIDFTFQEILDKSNEIKGLYENTKATLYKAIDTIMLNTLENEFNAIKPNITLF